MTQETVQSTRRDGIAEAVLDAGSIRIDAVSYTHLTLPTNREV